MVSVIAFYPHEFHAPGFEVLAGDGAWLKRQAHTLRLEGDYVGAQWLERNLRDHGVRFILPSETNLSAGQAS